MNRKAHKVRRVVVAPALSTDPLQAHNSVNSRSQNRGISRGNSLKGNSLVQQQDSRCISDGKSFTARSKELDLSESSYTADCDDSAECCNMKLMDLQGEKFRGTYYNHFEERIVEERQVNKLKHKGRSIGSIRNNPNESLLSLTKLSKLTSGSSSMRGITMITDNILLGGREEAENIALLLEYGVSHVLNTAQQLPNYFPGYFVYLKLGLIDSTQASIVRVADSVVNFLSHIENIKGRVFVHCLAGVSRSVSAILMHMMLRHRLPLQSAFNYVRSCRTQVCPNEAFKLQLARLEVQELGYSSVAKDADKIWDFYEWNCIKRSMPTVRPDSEDERVDALSGASSGHYRSSGPETGSSYLRQLSSSSIQDVQAVCCCVLS